MIGSYLGPVFGGLLLVDNIILYKYLFREGSRVCSPKVFASMSGSYLVLYKIATIQGGKLLGLWKRIHCFP